MPDRVRRRLRRPTHHRRVGLAAWRAVGLSSGTHRAASGDPPTLRCADVGPDGATRETARIEGAAHAPPSYPSPPRSSRSRRHAALRQRRPRRRAQVLDADEAAAAPGGGRLGARIEARRSSASKRTRRRLVGNRSPRSPSAVRRSRRSPARRTASSSSAAPWGASSCSTCLSSAAATVRQTHLRQTYPSPHASRSLQLGVPPAAPATGPAYAPSYLAYVDAHEGAVCALAVTGASLASGGAAAS